MLVVVAIPLLAALRSTQLVSRQQAVLLGGRAAGAAVAWRRVVPPAAAFTEEDCASCNARTTTRERPAHELTPIESPHF